MLYFPQSVVAHTRVIVAQEEWDPVQQMCPGPGQPHLTDVPVSKQIIYLLCYGYTGVGDREARNLLGSFDIFHGTD